MKKILVLVGDYPNNNGGVALMYVHVRNKYYVQHGIDVTVLNFRTDADYLIDGINVISKESYEKKNIKYDVAVLHAANIRNHYFFLKKYGDRFGNLIFFFHGHEVLKINEVYPEPYDYMKKNRWVQYFAQNCYDRLKLTIWHFYFKKVAYRTDFIFVSNWLYKEFQKYVKLSDVDLKGHVHIINNSVGKIFEENSYHYEGDKKYDFITIRNNMDSSTYCIDLVCELADRNPDFKFLLIGKGRFFNYRAKPKNVTWINQYLKHKEMLYCINHAKCALMLTRRDTQGVMSCELVTYGIPLITSELPVCREMFGSLSNVAFVDNEDDRMDLRGAYEKAVNFREKGKITAFSYALTVKKEELLIDL